ncbi:MAG: phosphotransferase [Tuberibacillus sp.]
MDWLSDDWVISSAGGNTGKAFVARSKKGKLFIKRNSSPFLAVLSAEGIVPKLLWTKRLENGDVITAQKWLEGRSLNAGEMKSSQVIRLLKKIHISRPLAFMLSRLGKIPLTPEKMCDELINRSNQLEITPTVREALNYLKQNSHKVKTNHLSVCHCDINHNNWLIDESGQLYLVDWDQAMLADPALDLSMILYWYVDPDEWKDWLKEYGWPLTQSLQFRLHWYIVARYLSSILFHQEENIKNEMELTRLLNSQYLFN